MPVWMRPYAESFVNTGGNSIEELMNCNVSAVVNMPKAMLCVAVKSQVSLLENLREKGLIK